MATLINNNSQPTAANQGHTPSTNTTPPTNAGNGIGATKKRHIRFSNTWDILLLKTVTAVDAHLSPHGEAQQRFEEALGLFKAALPAGCLEAVAAPTWKTLNDRFKKILSDHREASKNNSVASGIIGVRGERETLLDDIMLAVDEWEETKRAERDERTELDKRLLEAGEEIRARAVSIGRGGNGGNGNSGEGTPEKQEGKKRALSSDSDDEDRALMSEHIKIAPTVRTEAHRNRRKEA